MRNGFKLEIFQSVFESTVVVPAELKESLSQPQLAHRMIPRIPLTSTDLFKIIFKRKRNLNRTNYIHFFKLSSTFVLMCTFVFSVVILEHNFEIFLRVDGGTTPGIPRSHNAVCRVARLRIR